MATTTKKVRILIFQGVPSNTIELEHQFQDMGHVICAKASFLEEALELIKACNPEIIIMDIAHTGKIDSLNAADAIWKTYHLPIVFLADHEHLEQVEQVVAQHPYFHLLGSLRVAEIQMVINKSLYVADLGIKLQFVQATEGNKEVFHKALLENAADAIFLENLNNEIIDVSQKGCDLMGYSREELLDMKLSSIIASDKQLNDCGDRIRYELKNYSKMVFESVNLHKSGKRIPVEVTTSCLSKDNDGLVISIVRDLTDRKQAELEREQLITDLKKAIADVQTLSGLLPICASCKKIRDDQGYWNQIELYIQEHSEATFSHGICPECSDKLYGDEDWYIASQNERDPK